jgi:hypothetical protein
MLSQAMQTVFVASAGFSPSVVDQIVAVHGSGCIEDKGYRLQA